MNDYSDKKNSKANRQQDKAEQDDSNHLALYVQNYFQAKAHE